MPNVNSSMLRSKVCLIPNGANYLLTVAVAEKDIPTPTLSLRTGLLGINPAGDSDDRVLFRSLRFKMKSAKITPSGMGQPIPLRDPPMEEPNV